MLYVLKKGWSAKQISLFYFSWEEVTSFNSYRHMLASLLHGNVLYNTMMKFRNYIFTVVTSILLIAFISSCRTHKDCRGRKKTARTAMGGWL